MLLSTGSHGRGVVHSVPVIVRKVEFSATIYTRPVHNILPLKNRKRDLVTGDMIVMRHRNSSDSASEGILDELETIDLSLVEIVVERESYSCQV
jgi:hypothetical protein